MENPILNGKILPHFPCNLGKKPLTKNGYKDATTDMDATTDNPLYESLYKEGTEVLCGVPTGAATGFDILDVDPTGLKWAYNQKDIHQTRQHRTRRGGLHFLFQHVEGLRNSASKVAPGVDVRADGGYVIWWPVHGLDVINPTTIISWPNWLLDLQTKRNYKQTLPPHGMPCITPLWEWIPYNKCREALKPQESDNDIIEEVVQGMPWFGVGLRRCVPQYSREDRYCIQSAAKSAREIGLAEVGSRNSTLNNKAYHLGRMIGRGWLSRSDAIRALWRGAIECGLVRDDGPDSVIATIRSGLLAGISDPCEDLK